MAPCSLQDSPRIQGDDHDDDDNNNYVDNNNNANDDNNNDDDWIPFFLQESQIGFLPVCSNPK